MPGATKKNERKTERKWQLLLVLDNLPLFFLRDFSAESSLPVMPTPNACKVPYQASTSPRVEGKVTGMRKPQDGLEAWNPKRCILFTTLGGVYKVKRTNFDEFMIHCILHPKMNVGSFNKPDFTIQKKIIGYVNPNILSEFRHEPAVWHRSDHGVFGCQPKSSNQLHLKNCNSCPPSKPSTRTSDGHQVSLNF